MHVKLPDSRTIRVRFIRERGKPRPVTSCVILFPGGSSIQNSARPHPHDIVSKAAGRRVALGRTLADSGLSRDARRAVWEAYFSQHSDLLLRRRNHPAQRKEPTTI